MPAVAEDMDPDPAAIGPDAAAIDPDDDAADIEPDDDAADIEPDDDAASRSRRSSRPPPCRLSRPR
jgi:hypothetical protein